MPINQEEQLEVKNYIEELLDLYTEDEYENYLEIGCDKDSNFSKIKVKNKIGVDPIKGGNVRKTSDDFFKEKVECHG